METSEGFVSYDFCEYSNDSVELLNKDGRGVKLDKKAHNFEEGAMGGEDVVKSRMAGNIVKVFVKAGDSVKKGDSLLSLESMKMENIEAAKKDGVIKKVYVKEAEFVNAGGILVEYEAEAEVEK